MDHARKEDEEGAIQDFEESPSSSAGEAADYSFKSPQNSPDAREEPFKTPDLQTPGTHAMTSGEISSRDASFDTSRGIEAEDASEGSGNSTSDPPFPMSPPIIERTDLGTMEKEQMDQSDLFPPSFDESLEEPGGYNSSDGEQQQLFVEENITDTAMPPATERGTVGLDTKDNERVLPPPSDESIQTANVSLEEDESLMRLENYVHEWEASMSLAMGEDMSTARTSVTSDHGGQSTMADESPRNVVSPTLSGGSQTSEIPHMGDLMSQSVQRISMDEVEHIGDVLSDSLQELEQDNSSGSDSSNKLASHGAILAAATTPNDTGEYQSQQDQDDGRATSAFPGVAMAATLGLGAVADLDAEQNVATRPEQNYGMDDYGTTRDGELEPGQKAEIPFGTEADAAEYYGYGDGVDLEKEESAEIAFGMDTGSENSFLFNMVDSNTGFVDNGAQMNGSENDLLYNLEDPEDDSEEEKQETGYEAETRYEKDRAIPFETLGSHHEGPYLEDFMSSDGYSKSTSFATPSTPSSEDDEYAYEVERLAHAYEQQSARDVDYVRSVESPLSRAATKADREMTEREHSKMMRRMARKQARELEEQQWEAEMLRIFWYSLFTISIIIVVGAIVVSASNQGIKR